MNLNELVAQGGANPLLLAALAVLLGALHGLEPGHSKTMIAAYIIAVRGTVSQAVLLGVAAASSHVVIVWVLALLGLLYGERLIGERLEPWFMMASGGIILLLGAWIFRQSWRAGPRPRLGGHGHDHDHDHDQGHHHDHHHGHEHGHADDHGHAHGDGHGHPQGRAAMDAHARAHAREIETRLASGRTSTWQTILFGLTGGLIPCPAAITVLLLCLQLGKLSLGVTLVASFSLGLALTLVGVGLLAAVGLRYATRYSAGLDALLAKAPYLSAALIGIVGLLMIYAGWLHLQEQPG